MRKILFLSVISLFLASSTAALSCAIPPDQYTFHCSEENTCQQNFSTGDEKLHNGTEIPPENKTNQNRTDRREVRYVVEKVGNRDLPSADQALESAKSLCPGPERIHLYPKEDFKEESLKDTTKCYQTQIESSENYYKVTREPTTEPPTCIRKHQDSMISGGDRSWVGPISWTDMIIETIIINIIL